MDNLLRLRGGRLSQEKGKTEVFPLNKLCSIYYYFCAFEDGNFPKALNYYRRKDQRMEGCILLGDWSPRARVPCRVSAIGPRLDQLTHLGRIVRARGFEVIEFGASWVRREAAIHERRICGSIVSERPISFGIRSGRQCLRA